MFPPAPEVAVFPSKTKMPDGEHVADGVGVGVGVAVAVAVGVDVALAVGVDVAVAVGVDVAVAVGVDVGRRRRSRRVGSRWRWRRRRRRRHSTKRAPSFIVKSKVAIEHSDIIAICHRIERYENGTPGGHRWYHLAGNENVATQPWEVGRADNRG